MTRKPTKSSRPEAMILASAVAAIAMLALAGPASAHHGREDHHHHGRHHHAHRQNLSGTEGEAAGTIASFDPTTGKLAINLTGGETISGLVTEDTSIESGNGGCDHSSSGDPQQFSGRSGGNWGDDDDQGQDDPGQGSTADLVPGATVENAVLIIAGGHATFVKIELGPAQTPSSPPTP
jgi:hypothetical protein